TIRTRVWSIIVYKRTSFCCSLLLSTAIVLILVPDAPATCQHHCQAPTPCQDEGEDKEYRIGSKAPCEHHCQAPAHVMMKKNVRNTRLDQRVSIHSNRSLPTKADTLQQYSIQHM
ncbi:hypothetical protein K492DRAFT_174504, partial [Lichtheimia hyalospora FSU 10163]